MRMNSRFWGLILSALLFGTTCSLIAQGPPGGVPPGQAKKEGHMPPGQAKKYGDERGLPPGQAKKYLREQDRDYFYRHYREDADGWRGRRRPPIVVGDYIPPGVVVRVMPRTYWVNVAPPPPPGYRYGYCGGYVVAYNPTTRIVADVLDLINATRAR